LVNRWTHKIGNDDAIWAKIALPIKTMGSHQPIYRTAMVQYNQLLISVVNNQIIFLILIIS